MTIEVIKVFAFLLKTRALSIFIFCSTSYTLKEHWSTLLFPVIWRVFHVFNEKVTTI